MSTDRRRPDAGWERSREGKPHGPNGRRLCRRCAREVPRGRRTFCSAPCVHHWKLTTDPTYVRLHVFQRDRGVCARCRTDTEQLRRALCRLRRKRREEQLRALGVPLSRWPGSLWDADHIVPVVEGGGLCDLENYRTLCLPCHQAVTRELRVRLKQRQATAM